MESSRTISRNTYTSVKEHNGIPTLFINDKPVYLSAYMTYLDEHARYDDFTAAGYNIYTFPAYFAGRGINVHSGIGPFRRGIFDKEDIDDFSVFDNDVELILKSNSNAYIFPRISLDMPEWWEAKYPFEVNKTIDGKILRESFSSCQWRKDACNMLYRLIDHIEASKYSDNIMGYHLAGGGTEEWVHFGNPIGGFGNAALIGYRNYLKEKYNNDVSKLQKDFNDQDLDFDSVNLPQDYKIYDEINTTLIDKTTSKNLLEFLAYQSWIIADAISYFAEAVKEKIKGRLVVGAFYGYTNEIVDARNGHHCLKLLLRDKNIDFLCSPSSYSHTRAPGIDWANMSVLDSVKAYSKLWLSECDTRTWLTRPLKEARPSICPTGAYQDGVWKGPESKAISQWLIRKCFARSLITGTGHWWFDMWGGWYADSDVMKELGEYIGIQEDSLINSDRSSVSEVAVIVDEDALRFLNYKTGIGIEWNYEQRVALGWAGAPYDIFDVDSFDFDIEMSKYKLIIFLCVCKDSEKLNKIISRANDKGVNLCFTYLPGVIKDEYIDLENVSNVTGFKLKGFQLTENETVSFSRYTYPVKNKFSPLLISNDDDANVLAYFSDTKDAAVSVKNKGNIQVFYASLPNLPSEILREIYKATGVHLYIETNDVIYVNRNFISIHSSFSSLKNIKLPQKHRIVELIDGNFKECITDEILINMEQYETRIFRVV